MKEGWSEFQSMCQKEDDHFSRFLFPVIRFRFQWSFHPWNLRRSWILCRLEALLLWCLGIAPWYIDVKPRSLHSGRSLRKRQRFRQIAQMACMDGQFLASDWFWFSGLKGEPFWCFVFPIDLQTMWTCSNPNPGLVFAYASSMEVVPEKLPVSHLGITFPWISMYWNLVLGFLRHGSDQVLDLWNGCRTPGNPGIRFEPQIICWKTPTEARMWLKDMARESMLSMWPWSTLPRSDSKMFILFTSMLVLVAMKQTKV